MSKNQHSVILESIRPLVSESDWNKPFTGSLLKGARADARSMGIAIPKLTTYLSRAASAGSNKYYMVYDPKGNVVWEGQAYNAAEAKSKAVDKLVNEAPYPPIVKDFIELMRKVTAGTNAMENKRRADGLWKAMTKSARAHAIHGLAQERLKPYEFPDED